MAQGLHTILSFSLPFMIPIPDGIYEVKMEDRSALIFTKQIWRKSVAGFESSSGKIELNFDKYGMSGYTFAEIKFPWAMPEMDKGRQVALFTEPSVSIPRNKNKETAVRFMNRLIEVVRIVYDKFYLRNVRYSDILSWNQAYWNGKERIPAGAFMLDHGCGGIRVAGKMSDEQAKKETEKVQRMRGILNNDTPIPLERIFLANAKDACIDEDFRMATIESVTALEIVLYRFVRTRGKQLKISENELEDFIVKVGLTGNFKVVLRMLTGGLEQPDTDVIGWCIGAITTRNDILHRGLRDLSPSETERRIENIEKMIDHLIRIQINA